MKRLRSKAEADSDRKRFFDTIYTPARLNRAGVFYGIVHYTITIQRKTLHNYLTIAIPLVKNFYDC